MVRTGTPSAYVKATQTVGSDVAGTAAGAVAGYDLLAGRGGRPVSEIGCQSLPGAI